MALLKAGKLGVEITISTDHPGFIDYFFTCKYASKPLFNSSVKFRKVFEYDLAEHLIGFFEQVSNIRQEDDPWEWFAAYEKVNLRGTLFYAEGWKNYLDGPDDPIIDNITAEKKHHLEEMDQLRAASDGMLPQDQIEIQFSYFDDKLLFSGDHFSGTGPGVRLLVRRDAVKKFIGQLRKEFKRVLKKNNLRSLVAEE